MLENIPTQYAAIFFLGIVLYTPVLLFSTGKYKSGLKCAAATCAWLLMIVSTARLAEVIYPQEINRRFNLASNMTDTSLGSMPCVESLSALSPAKPIRRKFKKHGRKRTDLRTRAMAF